jgi:hypothetical protein
MHIQIKLNIHIFQLEKKLGNKYEHVHEPMIFFGGESLLFCEISFEKNVECQMCFTSAIFFLYKMKKNQKKYWCKHINK